MEQPAWPVSSPDHILSGSRDAICTRRGVKEEQVEHLPPSAMILVGRTTIDPHEEGEGRKDRATTEGAQPCFPFARGLRQVIIRQRRRYTCFIRSCA